jgi:hypothetical protein
MIVAKASRRAGLLIRIVGAGVPPAHQSRCGRCRVSERQWAVLEGGR